MGLNISRLLQSEPHMVFEPGTYRIVHVATKTLIAASGRIQLVKCLPELTNKNHTVRYINNIILLSYFTLICSGLCNEPTKDTNLSIVNSGRT
jgi:hypothetical protein